MTSTTTSYYHHHNHHPSSSSTTDRTYQRQYSTLSRLNNSYNYSSSSPSSSSSIYSHSNKYSSSSSPLTSASGYVYKTRPNPLSSNSSTTSSSSSAYRPSTNYYNSTFSPKTSNYSNNSIAGSSYLSKYSSGVSSSTSSAGYSTHNSSTPVTLTRFNHRRSSFDHVDDIDSASKTTNNKLPVAGLTNLGNTCYMNSVLQALYATKQLRDYILTGLESGQLYSALSKLFKEMSTSIRFGYANPSLFRTSFIQIEPKFRGYEQQDAQEFLSYLTNDLHEEQNKAKRRSTRGLGLIEPKSSQEAWNIYRERFNDSKFVDLFVGQFSSVIKCSDCGNESTCWDPFWDISLPVPRYRSRVDIEECLAEFTAAETLDGNEQPFCSRCKKHRRSTKRLSIVRSPMILVLHLKKFSNDGYKLSSEITINQQLSMTTDQNNNLRYSNYNNNNHLDCNHLNNNYLNNNHSNNLSNNNNNNENNGDLTECDQFNGGVGGVGGGCSFGSTTYDLYACVCHHGFSSKSGHYTAYCQYETDKWFHCNDEKVKEVTDSFSMATLKDAYVLFYRKRASNNSYHSTINTNKYSSRL